MILRPNNRGIVLVEALAAAVVLALTVSAISMINSRSIRQYRDGQLYEQAWQILDSQLSTIVAMGPTDFIALGQTEGWANLPGQDEELQKFYWQVSISDENLDGLYDIDISITFGKNRKITAATMIYDEESAFTEI